MNPVTLLGRGCLIGLVAAGTAPCVQAQNYPERPIRIIVPLAPGGGNDTVARLVANKLVETLGQKVIVENRTGGGSVIASKIVLQAPADGYTLYLVSSSFTSAATLQKNLSFDPLGDFAPITRLGVVPGALTVHSSLPVASVKALVALANSNPGQITFGSAGIGSGSHLGGELFKFLSKANMLHVPYRGSALVTQSLLSGEVMTSFSNPLSALPYVKSGRLRILGVTTASRWPLLPQFPTIAEEGVPGYEFLIWNGMVVRAGTPQPIIDRVHRELMAITRMPDVVGYLEKNGSRPMVLSPADFGKFLKNEITTMGKVIRAAGVRVN
ncbi:MAG: tripartite tricarboxylate transporter substrate binding protein [Betaproteobacteria bacterium]|nr:tripartite tricarboxylate transporter substrate binding protein [Betaproteobacteria bacterium]